jgi:hypothetical protein
MDEIIKKIEETDFDVDPNHFGMIGYKITTDKQEILIGIYSGQSCCENYGYLISHDNIDEFIGSKLLGINITDDSLNTIDVELPESEECGAIFVNIETDKGTLQVAVYNSHNGYYGHSVIVKSNQLNYEGSL